MLDSAELFVRAMKEDDSKKKAVDLNRYQLKEQFMNSEGVQLSAIGGNYSPYTMSKGKKKDASSVDLYDTGEFHKSFRVENVSKTGFDIVSDAIKDDGTDLRVEWGPEIEGLTLSS